MLPKKQEPGPYQPYEPGLLGGHPQPCVAPRHFRLNAVFSYAPLLLTAVRVQASQHDCQPATQIKPKYALFERTLRSFANRTFFRQSDIARVVCQALSPNRIAGTRGHPVISVDILCEVWKSCGKQWKCTLNYWNSSCISQGLHRKQGNLSMFRVARSSRSGMGTTIKFSTFRPAAPRSETQPRGNARWFCLQHHCDFR